MGPVALHYCPDLYRRKVEGAARVEFLGTLPEEEWEFHQRDHENIAGCGMDRVAFMEEV